MAKDFNIMTPEQFNERAQLPENKELTRIIWKKAFDELNRINEMKRRNNEDEETSVVMWVPHRIINLDESYQRDVREVSIEHIIVNYNPNKVDVKSITFREDGAACCMDGQHTVIAREARNNTESLFKVYPYVNTTKEAAGMFSDQHDGTIRLTGVDKYKADLKAERDYALAIRKVCKERKITVKYVVGSKKHPELTKNNVNAINPLKFAYEHNKEEGLKVVFDIIIDAGWNKENHAFRSDCLMIGRTLCEIAKNNKTKAVVADENYKKVLDVMKAAKNSEEFVAWAHEKYNEGGGQHGEGSIRNYVKFICGVIE